MKYVRHDFVGNFINAIGNGGSDEEIKKLVIDEVAKIVVIEPTLVAEVLSSSGVKVSNKPTATELANKIHENRENPKLIKKLSKVVLLTNAQDENGKFLNVDGSLGKSTRSWFSKGSEYLKQNEDVNVALQETMAEIIDEEGRDRVIAEISSYQNFGGKEKKTPPRTSSPTNTGVSSSVKVVGVIVVLSVMMFGIYQLRDK